MGDGAARRAAPYVASGALVLIAVAATIGRQPALFGSPRFWAEEGTLYFSYAWTHPWYETLLYRPAGYLTLYTAAAAALAAGLAPLRAAPFVTTMLGFVAQTLPIVVIAASRSSIWGGIRRPLGIAIVLLGAITDEIWVTTTNSQFYMALTAFLLLLEDAPARSAWSVFTSVVVVLCGLTGPLSCALMPLFAIKAWYRRRTVDIVQTVLLATCAAIQLGLVLGDLSQGTPIALRREHALFLPAVPYVVWIRAILPSLVSDGALVRITGLIYRGGQPDRWQWTGTALMAIAVAFVGWLTWRLPRPLSLLLSGGFWICTLFSIAGALLDTRILLTGIHVAPRYFYVPGVIVLITVLQNVRRPTGHLAAVRVLVCAVLLASGLSAGAARWQTTPLPAGWPSWGDEVTAWESDPSHALRIAPERWSVSLSPPEAPPPP